MRSAGLLVVPLLLLAGSGCADEPAALVEEDAAATDLRLQCLGLDGGIPTLEASFLGSCWGHIGHHTYFVEEPVALVALTGQVFAVEISYTTLAGAPELPVELSLDGREWTTIGAIPYPLGDDPSDRYEIAVDLSDVDAVPFRFLRVSMPLSVHDGLAGYLDGSNLTAQVVPWSGTAPLAGVAAGDCSQGDVLEDFFAEHPCWFGGVDRLDQAQGGEPDHLQTSSSFTDESWFDSPSFLHTYVLPGGAGGPLQAGVTAQLWRLAHYGTCSGGDPLAATPLVVALADVSPDGREWTRVAEAEGATDQPIDLEGTVPDGMRFLRFATQHGASWDAGGCHHPQSFLVDSSFTMG